jgi:hypothetical protein
MRGYALALMVSLGVFTAGLSLGYLCIHLLNMSPWALLALTVATPSAQATIMRAEAVSQAVEIVVGSITESIVPQPEKYPIYRELVRYFSTALGILSTNMVTALGAALTPLLPVLWQRRVTPSFMRLFKKSYDPVESWRYYFRHIVPLPPVAILGFNGFVASLVTAIAGGVIDFMIPEMAGIICLAAVGMRAALNSGSPESVEASYSGFWRIAGLSTLFLVAGALMEARLLV